MIKPPPVYTDPGRYNIFFLPPPAKRVGINGGVGIFGSSKKSSHFTKKRQWDGSTLCAFVCVGTFGKCALSRIFVEDGWTNGMEGMVLLNTA